MRILRGLVPACALCLAVSIPSLSAQPEIGKIRKYADDKAAFTVMSISEGLPSPAVSALAQDSNGFIWMGTWGGLCRFDGSGFKIYENEPFNETSLASNQIQTMYMESADVLWIGTYSGLDRFDIASETFVHYKNEIGNDASLSNDLVISLCRDARGFLWIGTLNGLNRLDEKNQTLTRYFNNPGDPHSIPNNTIRSLLRDSKGRLWVGTTGGGLASYDYENDRFDRVQGLPGDSAAQPTGLSMQAIAEDSGGVLWLGLWGRGLIRYNPLDGSSELYAMPDSRIYAVNAQDQGRILVGSWGGGLFVVDKDSAELSVYKKSTAVGALPHDIVYSILQDASGELWIGTNGGGCARMDRTRRSFSAYVSDPGDKDSLPAGQVIASIVDRKGRLWASVNGEGIARLDAASGKWLRYRHLPSDPESLGDNNCNNFYQSSRDELWVVSNNGLCLLKPDERGFSVMRHIDGERNSLSSNIITTILEDPKGNFWIGTYMTGLDYWNRESGRFEHYCFDASKPDSISDNLVRSLAYDERGRLWIATNKGLSRHEGNGVFVNYLYDAANKSGISSNAIQLVFNDSKGILWIGTRGGGLMRYVPETDSFRHITRKDGLPSNVIFSLLEDYSGDLWIVTQTGIAFYDRETENVTPISLYKEMRNVSYFSGCCVGLKGELYFGSIGIIMKFNPALYETNQHIPPVFVTEIKTAGLSKLSSPATQVDKEHKLRLERWENSIEFRFAALDFRNPSLNLFSYKLDGFDKGWSAPSTRNFASYTNLPGGNYVFRVRASNNDGLWNEKGALIHFHVAVSPFLSPLAFVAYLIAMAVLSYGIAQLRSQKKLSQKIDELTEAQIALEAAGAEARNLAREADKANRAKSDFIATISHEIRTPLNGVIGTAELLERSKLDARQSEYLETIRHSGRMLLRIINDVLDFSKIEAGRIEIEDIPFDPRELVGKVKASFSHAAAQKSLYLETEFADRLPRLIIGDPLRVEQILCNLVGNAIKFTPAGGVKISLCLPPQESGFLEFRISDTGIGISEEQMSRLFKPFSQADQSTTRNYGGTGLGLAISRRFASLMGGDIEARSVYGLGSVFSFRIPLKLIFKAADEDEALPEAQGEPETGQREGSPPPECPASSRIADSRILVVDDDPVNRKVASRLLEELGARAWEAESGYAAIAALERGQFDAVLMDCSIPGMDGFETTRRIRASGGAIGRGAAARDAPGDAARDAAREIPIIAMTAHIRANVRERCLAAGMNGFLAKPITLESLRRSLEATLDGKETQPSIPGQGKDERRFRESDFVELYSGEPGLAREILELFLQQSTPLLAESREAFNAGDWQRIHDHTHKLKGSAGAIGAPLLTRLAARAMTLAAEKDGPRLSKVLEELDIEYESLEAELRAFMARNEKT